MSYQVLARKYRPQNFEQLVGQEHVTQALINGLEQQRIHHAFLFTGTRGVGKTTLARILAKALNCEQGVTGRPCGECGACREIAAGRFVDLVEVDAASRTGVDDTRDLLDNVQYAPSKGRYKVYLIDEVHMFSHSSFNALLKTLEEPPPHVKFLLATTDPTKLPATVLSRCLQFNLKRLDIDQISRHLAYLLDKESVEYESPALELLARAADGSMRDALSLLDQALAYGANKVMLEEVRLMLGIIEQRHVTAMLEAVVNQDVNQLGAVMQDLFSQAPDYGRVLQDLALLLHEISLCQVLGKPAPNALFSRETIHDLGNRLTPEMTQLYYQICLIGYRDMALAPDAKTGFESTMVRLFGFTLPGQPGSRESRQTDGAGRLHIKTESRSTQDQTTSTDGKPAIKTESRVYDRRESREKSQKAHVAESSPHTKKTGPVAEGEASAKTVTEMPELAVENWPAIFSALKLRGAARELARVCRLQRVQPGRVTLILDRDYHVMLRDRPRLAVRQALQQAYGHDFQVEFQLAEEAGTALQGDLPREEAANVPRKSAASGTALSGLSTHVTAQDSPLIQELKKTFDAEIIDVQHKRKQRG